MNVKDWSELALLLARKLKEHDALLEICQEIASDPRCDLVTSERRVKLYKAIIKAGGTACINF